MRLTFNLVILSLFTLLISCGEPSEKATRYYLDEENSFINTTDSIPQVIISSIVPIELDINFATLDEGGSHATLNGVAKLGADMDGDGIKEIIFEQLTEDYDTIYGKRSILQLRNGRLKELLNVRVNVNKTACNDILGRDQKISFDTTSFERPTVVVSGRYGYSGGINCQDYVLSTMEYFYDLPQNQAYPRQQYNLCSVDGNKLNLSKFYAFSPYKVQNAMGANSPYHGIYSRLSTIQDCDNIGNGLEYLEKISGLKYLNRSSRNKRDDLLDYIGEEYQNINPAFVKWASNNLIPDPDDKQVNGFSYKWLYDYVYKNQTRLLAVARLQLLLEGKETAIKTYAQRAHTLYYDENEGVRRRRDNYNEFNYYLDQKHNAVNTLNEDFSLVEGGYAERNDYGFWARRMLDGSDKAIWDALVKIFNNYDKEWYEENFVNKKWKGMTDIAQNEYDSLKLIADQKETILGPDMVPSEMAVQNNLGVVINLENGETKEYKNVNSDGESYAHYTIEGLWPKKNSVIVNYGGWEWGETYVVDLADGEVKAFTGNIETNEEATLLAEQVEEMDFTAMNLYSWSNGQWVKSQSFEGVYFSGGFWHEGEFYFKSGKSFLKYGNVEL